MDVLVLCAGEGKRLRPLTDNIPKPLLPISETDSILSRLLSQLTDSELVENIYVNVSFLPGFFLDYIVNLDRHMRPNVLLEESPLGSALTLKQLLPRLSQPILVIHGDLILEGSQISKMLLHFNSYKKDSFMVGHRRRSDRARSIIYRENGRISFFKEFTTPLEFQDDIYSNSGIYFFAQDDLKDLETFPLSTPNLVDSFIPYLISSQRLFFYSWDGWRFAIDSIETLDEVRQKFSLQII